MPIGIFRYQWRIFVSFVLVFSLTSISYATEITIKVNTQFPDTEKHVERIRTEAQRAIDIVTSLIGSKGLRKLFINIEEGGICRTTGSSSMRLASHRVFMKQDAIFHEVTHLLANHKDNRFFSEGLAIYTQDKYGEYSGFPNFYKVPIHTLLNYRELISIKKLHRNNEIFKNIRHSQRTLAYIQAGSFFTFLSEKYGEDALKDLNLSKRLNYKKIFGKPLESLEEEWWTYLGRQ